MLESCQQCLVSSSGDTPCWGNGCSNQPLLPSLEKLPVRTSCPLGIACALAAAQFEKPSVQGQSNQEWCCECLHTPAKPQQPDASAQSSARKGLVGNGELVDSTLILGKFSAPNLAWNCIVSAAPHARPFLSTIGHPMQSVDPARSFEGGKEVFFSSHTTHHRRERAHWGNVSRILWTAAGYKKIFRSNPRECPLGQRPDEGSNCTRCRALLVETLDPSSPGYPDTISAQVLLVFLAKPSAGQGLAGEKRGSAQKQ